MKIVNLTPNTVQVEGAEDEVRALAHLLGREVVVLDAKLLDASPGALLARANGRRLQQAISWREVARQTGTTSASLSRWATGKTLPSARTLTAIAKWLEIP